MLHMVWWKILGLKGTASTRLRIILWAQNQQNLTGPIGLAW